MLYYGCVEQTGKKFPPFSDFEVAGCYLVVQSPLCDKLLWVKTWVGAVSANFVELKFELSNHQNARKSPEIV